MSAPIDDGGPAFPLQCIGPDFPPGYVGMSLRDWFAGQVLAGLNTSFADTYEWPNAECIRQMAGNAYLQADAMLAARKQKAELVDRIESILLTQKEPTYEP